MSEYSMETAPLVGKRTDYSRDPETVEAEHYERRERRGAGVMSVFTPAFMQMGGEQSPEQAKKWLIYKVINQVVLISFLYGMYFAHKGQYGPGLEFADCNYVNALPACFLTLGSLDLGQLVTAIAVVLNPELQTFTGLVDGLLGCATLGAFIWANVLAFGHNDSCGPLGFWLEAYVIFAYSCIGLICCGACIYLGMGGKNPFE